LISLTSNNTFYRWGLAGLGGRNNSVMSSSLVGLSIGEVGRLIRGREATVREVLDAHLAHLAATEPLLRSFFLVLEERAHERARQLDSLLAASDAPLMPLLGVPVGVKDMFDVDGTSRTLGCALYTDERSTSDAAAITRLETAGALLVGKLSMDEFAMGVTGVTPIAPRATNPWGLDRISGGSSSGCGSAVAGLQCVAALGTDSAGSIRIPAALCGLTGFKPTFGSVTRNGVARISWSLDHVGPIARTARDAAAIFASIRGYDPGDQFSSHPAVWSPRPTRTSLADLRIGLALDGTFAGADHEVIEAVARAATVLEEAGAHVEPVTIAIDVPKGIIAMEAAAAHWQRLERDAEMLGGRVRDALLTAAARPGRDYAEAKLRQENVRCAIDRVFVSFDLLLTPTTPCAAPSADEDESTLGRLLTRYTAIFNQAGVPVVTLPCGYSAGVLPLGMQLVAAHGQDDLVLAAAAEFQELSSFHLERAVPTAAAA
jgi:aspartyl-tRNA(Asn)/glutamyl-tRNA(Gln) amidotransferase subunit A